MTNCGAAAAAGGAGRPDTPAAQSWAAHKKRPVRRHCIHYGRLMTAAVPVMQIAAPVSGVGGCSLDGTVAARLPRQRRVLQSAPIDGSDDAGGHVSRARPSD